MHNDGWYSKPPALPKILLVDDNQLNIKVLYELFREDHDVFIA